MVRQCAIQKAERRRDEGRQLWNAFFPKGDWSVLVMQNLVDGWTDQKHQIRWWMKETLINIIWSGCRLNSIYVLFFNEYPFIFFFLNQLLYLFLPTDLPPTGPQECWRFSSVCDVTGSNLTGLVCVCRITEGHLTCQVCDVTASHSLLRLFQQTQPVCSRCCCPWCWTVSLSLSLSAVLKYSHAKRKKKSAASSFHQLFSHSLLSGCSTVD